MPRPTVLSGLALTGRQPSPLAALDLHVTRFQIAGDAHYHVRGFAPGGYIVGVLRRSAGGALEAVWLRDAWSGTLSPTREAGALQALASLPEWVPADGPYALHGFQA